MIVCLINIKNESIENTNSLCASTDKSERRQRNDEESVDIHRSRHDDSSSRIKYRQYKEVFNTIRFYVLTHNQCQLH